MSLPKLFSMPPWHVPHAGAAIIVAQPADAVNSQVARYPIRAAPVMARPPCPATQLLLQRQLPRTEDDLELLAGRAYVHRGRAITGAARIHGMPRPAGRAVWRAADLQPQRQRRRRASARGAG